MIKTVVAIDGMMCGMCEAHMNEAIRGAFKVKKVESSHTKNQTVIISEAALDEAKLTELIYLIAKDNFEGCLSSGEERSYTVAEHIKAYIDSDQGFDMSLDDFEKHFSYSKYHLEKLFTERYGESLISYRNKRRMNLARQLMSDHSVSEVTELLGFSSIYVFSRAFKHRFGISPQGYKESKKN